MYSDNEKGTALLQQKRMETINMNKNIMMEMDALQHDKVNGFYDSKSDMYFEDLNGWLAHHGYTWSQVGC